MIPVLPASPGPLTRRHPPSTDMPHPSLMFRSITIVLACLMAAAASRADDVPDFENDLMPVLTKYGCNAGACHGKARGQGGFQLSLLGFDPESDYDAITREGRGRRIFPAAPEQSLLLRKPTALTPHGGGRRVEPGGPEHQMLRNWIVAGLPRRAPNAPTLKHVVLEPNVISLQSGATQALRVTAEYDDGTTRDVTRLTSFQSNEDAIVSVDQSGLVTAGTIMGDAAVMARFMNEIVVCNVTVPLSDEVDPAIYAGLPRRNFVDELVWNKLERLNVTPSDSCSDSTFLRRATTDIIGRMPTSDEVRAFLADESPDKRDHLVDRLLEHPEFADHWANKWVDLLRPNPYRVGMKAVFNYDNWIRQSFRDDKPWDQFVRELLTAQGSTYRNGAVTLFRDRRSPDEVAPIASQLFLGIRLECAKCHHHPFEVWGQDDFYSFAAYFAEIKRKGTGLSPPISGSPEYFYAGGSGSVTHPLTNEVLPPRPLFGEAPAGSDTDDPRVAVAAWMTSPDNSYFAQVMANRIWADLMGRGLVEPVDDLRATNPASNQPLLEELGNDFRDSGYSIRSLIRRIATSHVYGLSSIPNERNVADTRNYSRHYRQRLRAEVLLDSVCQITGIPESFDAMPPGATAKELWTHRSESLFLDAFGRPDPNQDPPCERTTDSTVVQSLHLMNSQNLYTKVVSDDCRASALADSEMTPTELVSELYQSLYSRLPNDSETAFAVALFEKEGATRRSVVEDMMWAMMNSPEFVIQD